ncbi:unnamed protein product [Prorocentrum cordatum]|uniref:Uncharacterized protein n=1 Tax=Prorocentrum cordatum TaxID=2364126 RepID=A0ABN9W7E1_9DINO|nr:unnamed protein product [Polarella glacialis]
MPAAQSSLATGRGCWATSSALGHSIVEGDGEDGRRRIEERVRSRWGGSEEPASLHKSMGSLAAAWRRPRSRGRAIGRTPPDCDRAADDSSLLTETMAFAGRA